MWLWYSWLSETDFVSWHQTACLDQNIPYAGYNAFTGDLDVTAQWTVAYTSPVVVAPNDVRARVEWFIAEKLSDGIGVPCEAPEFGDV